MQPTTIIALAWIALAPALGGLLAVTARVLAPRRRGLALALPAASILLALSLTLATLRALHELNPPLLRELGAPWIRLGVPLELRLDLTFDPLHGPFLLVALLLALAVLAATGLSPAAAPPDPPTSPEPAAAAAPPTSPEPRPTLPSHALTAALPGLLLAAALLALLARSLFVFVAAWLCLHLVRSPRPTAALLGAPLAVIALYCAAGSLDLDAVPRAAAVFGGAHFTGTTLFGLDLAALTATGVALTLLPPHRARDERRGPGEARHPASRACTALAALPHGLLLLLAAGLALRVTTALALAPAALDLCVALGALLTLTHALADRDRLAPALLPAGPLLLIALGLGAWATAAALALVHALAEPASHLANGLRDPPSRLTTSPPPRLGIARRLLARATAPLAALAALLPLALLAAEAHASAFGWPLAAALLAALALQAAREAAPSPSAPHLGDATGGEEPRSLGLGGPSPLGDATPSQLDPLAPRPAPHLSLPTLAPALLALAALLLALLALADRLALPLPDPLSLPRLLDAPTVLARHHRPAPALAPSPLLIAVLLALLTRPLSARLARHPAARAAALRVHRALDRADRLPRALLALVRALPALLAHAHRAAARLHAHLLNRAWIAGGVDRALASPLVIILGALLVLATVFCNPAATTLGPSAVHPVDLGGLDPLMVAPRRTPPPTATLDAADADAAAAARQGPPSAEEPR